MEQELTLSSVKKTEKAGDKCLKTGFFQWSKDFAGAAGRYDRAAEGYITLKQPDLALKVYKKLCDVNAELSDHWGIARNFEGMINCYKLKGVNEADVFVKILKESYLKYQLADSLTSFLTVVNEIAHYFEEKINEGAQLEVLEAGYGCIKNTQEMFGRFDLIFKIVEINVRELKYVEAIKMLLFEYGVLKGVRPEAVKLKTFACDIVVLGLLVNDPVLSRKYLEQFSQEIKGFYSAREFDFLEKSMNAFNEKDQKTWNKQMNSVMGGSVFPTIILNRARKMAFGKVKEDSDGSDEEGEDTTPKEEANPFF